VLRRSVISLLLVLAGASAWARTRPHYGGALRVETAGDAWLGSDAIARRLVLDGLTMLDASGTVQPALALSWDSDDSGHRWQLRLRPGVKFHDGTPLTSTAVVQSLNLACVSSCPWSAVRAVGSAVVFTSDAPLPNLPGLLSSDQFLIVLTRSADGQTPAQLIGTGPFQVSASAGNIVSLTANESCWQGRPFLDQISITTHRAVRDQWMDLTLGRADIVEVRAEEIKQAQRQRLTVVVSPPVQTLVLQLSTNGLLANPLLRTSIAYAVDRGAISNVIFQKQGEVTASLLPKSLTGYAFLFPTERDLNKSTQVRGGLKTGTLILAAEGDATMQLTAQRLSLNLHEAGWTVQIAPGKTSQADLVLRKLPIAGADAPGVLARILLAAGTPAAVVGPDPQALYQAERDILNQHTLVPLLDLPRAYALGGRVHNFALRADGSAELAGVSVEDAQ
jgi:peptide/nickel transport system substrate-binding protein